MPDEQRFARSYGPVVAVSARAIAMSLEVIILTFLIGEGAPKLARQPRGVQIECLGLAMILIGLPWGWLSPRRGGAMVLGGVVLFAIVEAIANSAPPAGFIYLLIVPGVLYLWGAELRDRARELPLGSRLGVDPGQVRIVAGDSHWPQVAAAEALRLAGILGVPATSIDHVGSTAVPGLDAMPVIDLCLRADASDLAALLKSAGYRPNPGRQWGDSVPFIRQVERKDVFSLWVLAPDSPQYARMLALREALRANEALCQVYARLKHRQACAAPADPAAYARAKEPFLAEH